jgi:hypothetical protein
VYDLEPEEEEVLTMDKNVFSSTRACIYMSIVVSLRLSLRRETNVQHQGFVLPEILKQLHRSTVRSISIHSSVQITIGFENTYHTSGA